MPDPSTDDLTPVYQQLLAQTLNPTPVQMPPGPSPSSHEGRGFLSLLGEALGGGSEYGTTGERETAGIRALGALGARMLQASDYSYQPHTLGSIIGQGMGAAGESLGRSGAVSAAQAAAAQDYAEKQQTMQLARIKEAVPILTALQTQRNLTAARNAALGGSTPGTTPGTSLALTGDLEKDRAIIAQRESGGDPTALNYVARADPTALARGATASGKYQFVNSTWREGLQLAGLDPSKYATARDAPESVQDQVFTAVYKKYGTAPWDPSTWKSNWVQDPTTGKYNLVQGAPYQPPPGKGTTTTASTAPAAPATAAPAIIQGKPGEPAPPPPNLPPGPATTYAGGGIGTALAPKLPEPPIPPPGGVPVPGGGGLVLNPDTGRIGTPGGGFKAADIIEHGMQLARASRAAGDGSVLAAGPAAPTTVATAPAPQGGFVGGATSYGGGGPATVTPPAAPAPQPASQAPPPPATPPVTLPAGAEPEPPPYTYARQPLPPDIQARIANPLPPEQLALYDQQIRGAATLEAIQAAQEKKAAAIAAARAEAVKEAEAWQQNERNKGQDIWQKRWDAWRTNENQRQQNAQKFEQDKQLEALKSDVALRSQMTQKVAEPILQKAEAAQAMLKNAQNLELFARQAGDASALFSTDFGKRATNWIVSLGGNSEWAREAAARQSWDTLVNGMFNDVHVPGMGSQSDRETSMLQSQWGSVAQTPLDRMTQLAIIRKNAEARIADAQDVQRLIETNQPASGIHELRKQRQIFDRPPVTSMPVTTEDQNAVSTYNASHPMGEPYVTWAPKQNGGFVLKWARNTGDPKDPIQLLPKVDVAR